MSSKHVMILNMFTLKQYLFLIFQFILTCTRMLILATTVSIFKHSVDPQALL